jgi:hypothetical protein
MALVANSPSEGSLEGPRKNGSALRVMKHETQLGHLYFWVCEDWIGEVPADQQELMIAFENVAAVLRARFLKEKDSPRFSELFDRLLKLAQAGFNVGNIQIAITNRSLEQFKSELVQAEGSKIKHVYLKNLGIAIAIASFLIILAAIGIHALILYAESSGWVIVDNLANLEEQTNAITTTLQRQEQYVLFSAVRWNKEFSFLHLGILLVGTMIGIWLSFSVRNMNLTFLQLQNPEPDLMRPWIRLFTFGLLAFLLSCFFYYRVIVVSIGDIFSTSLINDDALVAFIVGIALGFSDKVLPVEVQKRVKQFFSSSDLPAASANPT